jgi:DNA-binding transcriptional ArsR family regulator
MAGRPLKKKMLSRLADLAASDGLTLAEYVYDFIAGGRTLTDLAGYLGVSRSYASRHLNELPEVREALSRARMECADAIAEQSLRLSDDLAERMDRGEEVGTERIGLLREQNSVRKWLAAVANPEKYGKNDSQVTINIGDLHLDALRKSRMVDVTPVVKGLSDGK